MSCFDIGTKEVTGSKAEQVVIQQVQHRGGLSPALPDLKVNSRKLIRLPITQPVIIRFSLTGQEVRRVSFSLLLLLSSKNFYSVTLKIALWYRHYHSHFIERRLSNVSYEAYLTSKLMIQSSSIRRLFSHQRR